MTFLSYEHALQLKGDLKGTRAEVLTYESEEYAKSIQRWSDTCEKEAVRARFPNQTATKRINRVSRALLSEPLPHPRCPPSSSSRENIMSSSLLRPADIPRRGLLLPTVVSLSA